MQIRTQLTKTNRPYCASKVFSLNYLTSPCTLGWTNTPEWWVGAQYNMANAVSMPRQCFPKISEFMKGNWPGAARIQFIRGNHGFYNGAKPKKIEIDFFG